MTAAVIALAVCVAGALSTIAWLVYRTVAAADLLSQERVAHTKTRGTLEREQFVHDVTKQKLEESERVVTALEEVLADVSANPNSDLPPGDIVSRVRRAAAQAARDRAGAAGANATGEVPPTAPAAEPGTASVSAVVGLDDKLLIHSD